MSNINFDANHVAPAVPFEVLPQGDYLAVIDSSEVKTTKDGTGKYIELVFQVIEGEYQGRKLWERLTWEHAKSEKAVQIGHSQLSSICRAVGAMNINDTAELHGKPLMIKVGHEKRSDNGELTNRVKGYSPAATAHAAAGNVPGAVVNGSSKAALSAPAWARK